VYVANSPDWIITVHQTVNYLKENLKADETFLALPYDALYYFLTQKDSPVQELEFFGHTNMPLEQERKIISALEQKKVNYVLISSGVQTSVERRGKFGQTYCQLLSKYIDDHFKIVAVFGNWEDPPRKSWENHGVKILKRIEGH